MNQEYFQKVYEGLLGKVIGVYLGRPVEGWEHEKIKEKFGEIDRFVADEIDLPLVVADDDITGTITFFKALADSGRFEHTDYVDFADNWLNYLIEFETVLWWGGYGMSTEHTAYINLKKGMLPPESGSIETNGKMVAEQIGAQIFIDAFGLATPGRPELAARLAEKAARVSHDGEAVYGAIMQAVMVSNAFTEKDIHAVIKKSLPFIPKESTIAALYSFAYQLKEAGKSWREAFEAIRQKYGYHHFKGGNCHMIPNHAVMAMAFVYSDNDFYQSQLIINTVGWDTDCNAANVGSVMGVLCGLDGIRQKIDYQSFFQDRLLLPTADGTDAVSDVLTEAFKIASVGSKIMGYEDLSQNLPLHHFALHGSYHGYRGYGQGMILKPASKPQPTGLYLECDLTPQSTAGVDHLNIPVSEKPLLHSSYLLHGTPLLYSGMGITFSFDTKNIPSHLKVALWLETSGNQQHKSERIVCEALSVTKGNLHWVIPSTEGVSIQRYGLEMITTQNFKGTLHLREVSVQHTLDIDFKTKILPQKDGAYQGWVKATTSVRSLEAGNCFEACNFIIKNEGTGFLITGNRSWDSYEINVEVAYKIGAGGIAINYQGLNRYTAVLFSKSGITLEQKSDRTVNQEYFTRQSNELEFLPIKIQVQRNKLTVWGNNHIIIQKTFAQSLNGGIGYIVQDGSCFLRNLKITSL